MFVVAPYLFLRAGVRWAHKIKYNMARKRSGKMIYEDAIDLQKRMDDIVKTLGMNHVDVSRVKCLRSSGSSSRGTIARCHTLGKVMQLAMGTQAWYAIEFLERFEKMSLADQDRVIIHELMHIPKSFGGGFRHHDFVSQRNVDILYNKYANLKRLGFN